MALTNLNQIGVEEDPNKKYQTQVGPGTQAPGTATGADAFTLGSASSAFTGLAPNKIDPSALTAAPRALDFTPYQFEGDFAAQDVALRRTAADRDLARKGSITSINQQFDRSREAAQSTAQRQAQALKEQLASRGLFRSGTHVQEQGKVNEELARFLDNLAYERGSSIAGVESDFGTFLSDLAARREGLFGQQTRYKEEQARIAAERQAAAERAQREAELRQQEIEAQRAAAAEAQRFAEESANRQAALMAQLLQQRIPEPVAPQIYYSPPPAYQAPAPPPQQEAQLIPPASVQRQEPIYRLPSFSQGTTRSMVEQWVNNNVPGMAGNPAAINEAISRMGGGGQLTNADIADILRRYSGYGSSMGAL